MSHSKFVLSYELNLKSEPTVDTAGLSPISCRRLPVKHLPLYLWPAFFGRFDALKFPEIHGESSYDLATIFY